MKRFALLIATLGFFSACNSSDSIITCDRYDQWLASCSECSMTISCENNYDTLAPTVQLDLDECADLVLLDNIGICGSADEGWNQAIEDCLDLGAEYLGIVCDYGPFCGDGTCDADENSTNCEVDCPVVECGDGTCDYFEDPVDCPLDCAYLVCDDYQDWLEGCFGDCTALDSCDDEYGALDPATAQDVWDCAVFLADAAIDGLCADNIDGVCDILLEDELGSFGDCTF